MLACLIPSWMVYCRFLFYSPCRAHRHHHHRGQRVGSRSARSRLNHLVGERSRRGVSCGRERASTCACCCDRAADSTGGVDRRRHHRYDIFTAMMAALESLNQVTCSSVTASNARFSFPLPHGVPWRLPAPIRWHEKPSR